MLRVRNSVGADAVTKVVHMLDEFVASSDNGISYQTYAKGEFYQVPDHIATSMFRRKVAEPVTTDHIIPSDEPADLPALPKRKEG